VRELFSSGAFRFLEERYRPPQFLSHSYWRPFPKLKPFPLSRSPCRETCAVFPSTAGPLPVFGPSVMRYPPDFPLQATGVVVFSPFTTFVPSHFVILSILPSSGEGKGNCCASLDPLYCSLTLSLERPSRLNGVCWDWPFLRNRVRAFFPNFSQ